RWSYCGRISSTARSPTSPRPTYSSWSNAFVSILSSPKRIRDYLPVSGTGRSYPRPGEFDNLKVNSQINIPNLDTTSAMKAYARPVDLRRGWTESPNTSGQPAKLTLGPLQRWLKLTHSPRRTRIEEVANADVAQRQSTAFVKHRSLR